MAEREILLKNVKQITALGYRGLGCFLTKESRVLKWKAGTKVSVTAFKSGKQKGVLITKE